MRTLYFLSVLLLANFSYGQSKLSLGAGATLNFIDDDSGNFTDKVGAYIGVEVGDKLTDYIGYFGSLQYVLQRSEVSGLSVQVYSLSPAFAFKFYPKREKLYLFAGMQMSLITSVRVDSESQSDFEKSDFFFVTGLGYELNNRFSISSRYSHSLVRDYFDSTVQIGASYKLR